MMRHLALAVLLAACGDNYSLQIIAEMPEEQRYRDLIEKTVVTIYTAALDPLACEQIEFGDVTEDRLLGAAVAQQTKLENGDTEGELDNIPRLGRKVVVARMYGNGDILIAAGCSEIDDIDGDETLVVKTIVAATVAVDTVVDLDDPYGKSVTIVDPLGASIENRPVRWRLFAPNGHTPATTSGVSIDPDASTIWDSATPACTTRSGVATVRFVPPAKVAGFAARFRVSWPASPIDLISTFVRPGVGSRLLNDPGSQNRCAIRTAGERRVVCLEAVSTGSPPRARRYEVLPRADKDYDIEERGAVPINGARPIGVVSVDEAAGREVYAVLADGAVARLFGSATPSVTCTGCAIDDVRVAPACGNEPARFVMHSTSGPPIRMVPVTGGTATEFRLPDDVMSVMVGLNTAGCVTTIDPAGMERDTQVVVVDLVGGLGGRVTRAFFRCGTNLCGVTLPFPEAGVTFMRGGTATKPEMRLVGTAFDVAGAELIAWVLRATADGFVLIDRQRIVAASAPSQVLVGRLDGDVEPDLLWNIRGQRSSLLQISYAHTLPDGSRLSALAPLPVPVDEIALGDLTGDGFDDVVAVTANTFTVIPQNVEGPPVPDRTIETPACAP